MPNDEIKRHHETGLTIKKQLEEESRKFRSAMDKLFMTELDGWFDKNKSEMPDEKQELLKTKHPLLDSMWDNIDVIDRKYAAEYQDYQNDPDTEAERKEDFEIIADLHKRERKISELQLLNPQTPTEFKHKESELRRLQDEIDEINKKRENYWLPSPEQLTTQNWNSIKIEFHPNWSLHFVDIKSGDKVKIHAANVGLINKSTGEGNHHYVLLLGMSRGKKVLKKEKANISKLRKLLNEKFDINSDPFYPYNQADGYKPKFTLSDKRSTSDIQAKKQAKHVPLKDTHSPSTDDFTYEDEDDDAGNFLRNQKER